MAFNFTELYNNYVLKSFNNGTRKFYEFYDGAFPEKYRAEAVVLAKNIYASSKEAVSEVGAEVLNTGKDIYTKSGEEIAKISAEALIIAKNTYASSKVVASDLSDKALIVGTNIYTRSGEEIAKISAEALIISKNTYASSKVAASEFSAKAVTVSTNIYTRSAEEVTKISAEIKPFISSMYAKYFGAEDAKEVHIEKVEAVTILSTNVEVSSQENTDSEISSNPEIIVDNKNEGKESEDNVQTKSYQKELEVDSAFVGVEISGDASLIGQLSSDDSLIGAQLSSGLN